MYVKCSEFHVSVWFLVGTVGTLHGVIEESSEVVFTKVWVRLKETKGSEAPQG